MQIWQKPISLETLNTLNTGTAADHLGLEFTQVGDDFISARLLVDKKTMQPFGRLHGGVSVLMAETLGSCGAYYACAPHCHTLGMEINANHIKGVSKGYVYGTTRAFHLGRTTHVWNIELVNEAQELICISRITMAIIPNRT
jgi:1,4-dihydroxy-2-naphthoyl-CoA hydrolase